MKIRTGFVTNSSSTSYIVAIPWDFDLNMALSIREHANIFDRPDVSKERLFGFVDELQRKGYIPYSDSCNAISYLLELFYDLKFVKEHYNGNDGTGEILNVNHPDGRELA